MQVAADKSRVVRFGLFEVDLQEAELRKRGIRLKLQEQPFQILSMLLARPGQTVSREELQRRLWPADTFVDFDHSLNSSIKKLREALGDDAENPRFIETLHRRGYRFIAPVDGARASAAEHTELPSELAQPILAVRADWHQAARWWKWGATVVLVVGAMLLGLWLRSPLPPPRVVASQELTNDGLLKGSLLTDGSRIYFIENFNTAARIAQVSVTGGETVAVDFPIAYPEVLDVSGQRSELLIRGKDDSYWAMPLPGGSPRRLGEASGQCAVWAPDGRLVYAKGNDFYVAEHDGENPRKFATAPDSVACDIHFHPDGSRFRFTRWDVNNWTTVLWEARADGSSMHPVFSGNAAHDECCGHWTPDGKFYVFQRTTAGVSNIWIVRDLPSWWRKAPREPVELTAGPLELLHPLPSMDGKKLFALGRHQRGELVRYDAKSGEFVPYLGGISAGELAFSRDGQWVAYTSYPDGSLWRSRVDGSDRLQLTYPPMQAALEHWSPDGQQIAFSGLAPGRPWRIFLISKDGGSAQAVTVEKAAPLETNPTWSPDGKTLAFDHCDPLHCDQPFIEMLDLRTHEISELSGSRQKWAPRWSPDGRYMVAETSPGDKLTLYDFKNRKWQSVNGLQSIDGYGYLAWSRDSAYIYFDAAVSDESKYFRLRIRDSKLQPLLDVKKKLMRRFLGQFSWSWSGLGPDDAPLFVRDISTQEIYALVLQLP